uniref:Uncharacterized protein n=1 Tax=Arundo donax TaxID=35708 RepID=A0A0A8Y9K6_ARUDO
MRAEARPCGSASRRRSRTTGVAEQEGPTG